MKRAEFLKMAALLGVSLPLRPLSTRASTGATNNQRVIIIGAGAAGLTAAYLLKQHGITAQILEAAPTHGGRMKRITGFVDFPLPMGAEWLHTHPDVLHEVVNDDQVSVDIKTTAYDPEKDFGLFNGMRITLEEAGFKHDYKFINSTWFDFFEAYIVPHIQDQIQYQTVVKAIDYTQDTVKVDVGTSTLEADQVLITVPLKMLQSKAIHFQPSLPEGKRTAIENATVWDGFKAFIEFSAPFYPAFTAFNIQPETAGQKLFYDAAYGQNSNHHVLGLFSVGTGAQPYLNLSDDELIAQLLKELDDLFEGKASQHYIKHTSQNWNKEPYIQGAYLYDHESWMRVRTLGKPVGRQLFFAGAAYTNGLNWGGVDAVVKSASRAVNKITNG